MSDVQTALADLGHIVLDAEKMQELAATAFNVCCEYITLKRKVNAESIGAKLVSLQLTDPMVLGEFQKYCINQFFSAFQMKKNV